MVAGAAGGAIAIASMEAFSIRTAFPLVAIPFATSIVTVLGSPKAGPAQPRALIGGHLISTLVGLVIVKLCGPVAWAAALAVGLSMIAMHLTHRLLHCTCLLLTQSGHLADRNLSAGCVLSLARGPVEKC